MRFANLHAFATFVRDELPARIAIGKQVGLTAAGGIILDEMVGEIGTYQSGDAGFEDMQKLSPRTLDGWDAIGGRLKGKIERGYAAPGEDNPLKASGGLATSFGASTDINSLAVGSTDPNAEWQNDGTASRGVPFVKGATAEPGNPGREFIGRAAYRTASKAVTAVAAAIIREMTAP